MNVGEISNFKLRDMAFFGTLDMATAVCFGGNPEYNRVSRVNGLHVLRVDVDRKYPLCVERKNIKTFSSENFPPTKLFHLLSHKNPIKITGYK